MMDAKSRIITADALRAYYKPETFVVLDVRESQEVAALPFDGLDVLHISMHEVPQRLNEIDDSKEVVVVCHSGGRSGMVVDFLAEMGFERVYNLIGGVLSWKKEKTNDEIS